MEEGIAIKYYELLNEDSKARYGVILSRMCKELFNTPHSKKTIAMFSKFNRIYGKMLIYFVLLDLLDWTNLDASKGMYPVINYVAKKKIKEMADKGNKTINLNKVSEEIGKEIRRKKKENKSEREG